MSKNRSGVFVGGLMLGTAIGALAGLLAAPRTGRETRKLLKKSANALPELAEDLVMLLETEENKDVRRKIFKSFGTFLKD